MLGNRVMFVGAHPDDIELNAGGLAASLVERGAQVEFVICCSYEDAEGLRFIEACRACNTLGATMTALRFPDTKVHSYIPGLVSLLDTGIKLFKPDTVVTHFHDDSHQDHRAVNVAVMAAARLVPNLLMFQPTYPSGRTNIAFRPNLVVPLTEEQVGKKMFALSKYETQSAKYGNDNWFESIKAMMAGNAWSHGGFHGYAELFEISRIRYGELPNR